MELDDLVRVTIRTTADGPFAEDVFWLLQRADGSEMVVPFGADASAGLLDRLQQLPGFDNEAFIRAMASAQDGSFLCWSREDG